jgi:hypothetical protein
MGHWSWESEILLLQRLCLYLQILRDNKFTCRFQTVLTMVYKTRDYWDFDSVHHPIL